MCPPSPWHCFHGFFFFFSFRLCPYACVFTQSIEVNVQVCVMRAFFYGHERKEFSRSSCFCPVCCYSVPGTIAATFGGSFSSCFPEPYNAFFFPFVSHRAPLPHLAATRVPLWKRITSQPHRSSLGWDCLSSAQVMIAVAPVLERELKEIHVNCQDP